MALRDGMGTMVMRLRRMTQAGTADYTLAGTSYWSDAQLQDVLDRHVLVLNFAQMTARPEWNNGTLEWHDYYTPRKLGNLEESGSGTQYFSIEDSAGNEASIADFEISDYAGGWFRRTADTLGTQYQIKARSYNLHAAAAEVWEDKAANAWEMVDVRSDGEGLSLSQMQKHAMDQAKYHRQQAGAKTTELPGVQ